MKSWSSTASADRIADPDPLKAQALPEDACTRQVIPDFRRTVFVQSAARLCDLKGISGAEVAFAGRSNSGKSSALNALCEQRSLARTSRTPGRTRLINLFRLTDGQYLVDLPGYGYARVSEQQRRAWQTELTRYLERRRELRGLIITMDIRHFLKPLDRELIDWAAQTRLRLLLLLTKADKLGAEAQARARRESTLALQEFGVNATVQPFSAPKRLGIDETRAWIWETLNAPREEAASLSPATNPASDPASDPVSNSGE